MRSTRLTLGTLGLISAGAMLAAAEVTGPGTPAETAKAYIEHVKAGTAYAAIGQMFDVSDFLDRVFGADLDDLRPSDRVYVGELTLVSLKAATGMAPVEELKRARVSEPEVRSVTPSETVASVRIAFPSGHEHECKLRLARKASAWVIVDLVPTAETLASEWRESKGKGLTPIEFMELFAGSMMAERGEEIERRVAERRGKP